jgi:hypothetical protein
MAQAKATGDFGEQGQFIISADRLFQLFAYDNVTQNDLVPGGLPNTVKSQTTTTNQSNISLLYGGTGSNIEPFFTVPRVGFDYVVVPNVTIGGDIVAVFSLGGSVKHETDFNDGSNMTNSTNSPSFTGFGIAPRGGYVLGLSDMFSLWLRGGVSYYVASQKTTAGNNNNITVTETVNQFAIDLEPQIVFHIIPHVGFTGGIYADIPVTGGHSADYNNGNTQQSISAWSSIFYLGADLGMLAYF